VGIKKDLSEEQKGLSIKNNEKKMKNNNGKYPSP
jgi:hypothetical protein